MSDWESFDHDLRRARAFAWKLASGALVGATAGLAAGVFWLEGVGRIGVQMGPYAQRAGGLLLSAWRAAAPLFPAPEPFSVQAERQVVLAFYVAPLLGAIAGSAWLAWRSARARREGSG